MVRRLVITWVFNVVALYVASGLLSGLSYGSHSWALFGAALVFTLVSVFFRPVLAILSIPLIIATLGLFYLLINVFMLYLTHWIVAEFTIASVWWALLAALIISAVNVMLQALFGRPSKHARVAFWVVRRRRWLLEVAGMSVGRPRA
jgi:putative membrane protein